MKLFTTQMLLLCCLNLFAQEHIYAPNGIAVEGYDLVSYFDYAPKKGSQQFSTQHNSITYWFANEENLKKFQTDPEKYLPEFGGYCAYAVALTGRKVEVNPKTFKIMEDRLLLFYNKNGNDTKVKWDKNYTKYYTRARRNWYRMTSAESE